jgi:hypothetical protein
MSDNISTSIILYAAQHAGESSEAFSCWLMAPGALVALAFIVLFVGFSVMSMLIDAITDHDA